MAKVDDGGLQIPNSDGSSTDDKVAEAIKRAQKIAARIGDGANSDEGDSSRKRSLDSQDIKTIGGSNEPPAKRLAASDATAAAIDRAQAVAASIAARSGVGSIVVEEVKIPNKMTGLVIGKGGDSINKLQSDSGAKIQVQSDADAQGKLDRIVTITGTAANVDRAKMLIEQVVNEGPAVAPSGAMGGIPSAQNEMQEEIIVPANKVGLVIGKGGEMIRSFQERSQTRMVMIQDSTQITGRDKPLRICGEPQKVMRAKDMIMDFLAQHELESTSQVKPPGAPGVDFRGNQATNEYGTPIHKPMGMHTIEIPVPRDIVGVIIGRGGETIKRIQLDTGTKIQFKEDTNPNIPDRIAMLTGKEDSIQRANKMINELIMDKRRQPPHGGGGGGGQGMIPGQGGTAELPIPAGKCGLVIGKGGESIKQIIQQSGAHVELNRNTPQESPTRIFLIRGNPAQVQHAQVLIRQKIGDEMAAGNMQPGAPVGYPMPGQQVGYPMPQGQGFQNQQNYNQQQSQQQQPQQQQQQQQQQSYQSYPQQQSQIPQQPMVPAVSQPAGQDQASWANYYQNYYNQQSGTAPAGGQQLPVTNPTQGTPAAPSQPGAQSQQSSGQPDYTQAWVEYYRQQGLNYNPSTGTLTQLSQGGQVAPASGMQPGQMHMNPGQ